MEVSGLLGVLTGHGCAFYDLQLVQLEHVNGQSAQHFSMADDLGATFARQTQNEVNTNGDAARCCTLDSIGCTGEVVAAMDAAQGFVICALHAVLYQHKILPMQFGQIVQQFIAHAVRPRSNDEAAHTVHCQGFFVECLQVLQTIVRIRICLKIGQIIHRWIFLGEELFASFKLLLDAPRIGGIIGVKTLVIAVGATAPPYSSIAIGTSKPCVDSQFLHLALKIAGQKLREIFVQVFHRQGW